MSEKPYKPGREKAKPEPKKEVPREAGIFREYDPTIERAFGDVSDVFNSDGSFNESTFNFDAKNAYEKGHLIAKVEGEKVKFYLTEKWAEAHGKFHEGTKKFRDQVYGEGEKEELYEAINSLIAKLGFKNTQISKEPRGKYSLHANSEQDRTVVWMSLTGSLAEIEKKLQGIRKILKLLSAFELSNRFKLVEDKTMANNYVLEIFPEHRLARGKIESEVKYKGTAAQLWKALYASPYSEHFDGEEEV